MNEPSFARFNTEVEAFLDTHIPVMRHMELRPVLHAMLHAAATPPASHIIDETGAVRRVLGTLPATADGCVVGEQATVWRSADASITNEVRPEVLVLSWMIWSGQFGNVPGDLLMTRASGWYSTRAAAEAAKGAPDAK